MNIAVASDDNYAQHLGVMLESLLTNCSDSSKIKIYCMDGGISLENSNKIYKIVNKHDSSIKFITPKFNKIKKMNLKNHGKMTYTKIYLSEILSNLNRVLWLDSDIIVEKDVLDLKNMPIERYSLMCVSEGKDLHKEHKVNLGIPMYKHYFNAGVMLMNLKRFREKKYSQKIEKFLIENKDKIKYSDQDGFNAIIPEEDFTLLKYTWNFTLIMYRESFASKYLDVTRKELQIMKRQKKVIHFTTFKPWCFSTYHPEKHKYWNYLEDTPFSNFDYKDKSFKAIQKNIKQRIKFNIPGWMI